MQVQTLDNVFPTHKIFTNSKSTLAVLENQSAKTQEPHNLQAESAESPRASSSNSSSRSYVVSLNIDKIIKITNVDFLTRNWIYEH